MAKTSEKQKAIKTDAAAAIYALVGTDSLMQMEALTKVTALVGEDAQRTDFDGDEHDIGDVLEDLTSYAMFGPPGAGNKRLVVVRNGDELIKSGREGLENYCKSPSDSAVLVLRLNALNKTQNIAKLIVKNGEVMDCDPPKDAAAWAMKRAASEHGLKLGLEAAQLLVGRIGDTLGLIDQELGKLALSGVTNVTVAEVGSSVAFQKEQEMQALTAAMSAGNGPEAVARWRELIASDPSSEFRAVTWLGMWLDDVLLALREPGGARFKLAWKFKSGGTTVDQFMALCKTIGLVRARALQRRLTETDAAIKSGLGKAGRLVEQFVLEAAVLMR